MVKLNNIPQRDAKRDRIKEGVAEALLAAASNQTPPVPKTQKKQPNVLKNIGSNENIIKNNTVINNNASCVLEMKYILSPVDVICSKALKASDKLIFTILFTCAEDSFMISASLTQLSKVSCMTRSTVIDSLNNLEENNFIKKIKAKMGSLFILLPERRNEPLEEIKLGDIKSTLANNNFGLTGREIIPIVEKFDQYKNQTGGAKSIPVVENLDQSNDIASIKTIPIVEKLDQYKNQTAGAKSIPAVGNLDQFNDIASIKTIPVVEKSDQSNVDNVATIVDNMCISVDNSGPTSVKTIPVVENLYQSPGIQDLKDLRTQDLRVQKKKDSSEDLEFKDLEFQTQELWDVNMLYKYVISTFAQLFPGQVIEKPQIIKAMLVKLDKAPEWYIDLFDAAEQQKVFLNGEDTKFDWKCSLAWLLNEKNAIELKRREKYIKH